MIREFRNYINVLIIITYALILYTYDFKENYIMLLSLTVLTIIAIHHYGFIKEGFEIEGDEDAPDPIGARTNLSISHDIIV